MLHQSTVGYLIVTVNHMGHHEGAARGAGNDYPSGAPDFTSGFHRGSCCPVIGVSLFHVIVLS